MPFITISDASSGSYGDHRVEFEEGPNIVPINSSDLFVIETQEVITLEDETTDPGSVPEVTSCHMATGIREETTTSFASADVDDIVKGMENLFSQQEEVMVIQRSTGSGLRSRKNYKVNYGKPSTPTPSASPSLVVPMGQNVNTNVNERLIEPFKYYFVEHFKHIPARLYILDLLQMSKETRDSFIRELQALDPNNQVHIAQVHQIKKHQEAKSKRP